MRTLTQLILFASIISVTACNNKEKKEEKFMVFSQSKVYLYNVGHRMTGLADSRLLPTTEIQNN